MNGNLLAGKYLTQELIGKGGIGEIYKAIDQKKKRTVAIKRLMSIDKVRKRRFKREYRLLRKIDHPFFVRAFDFFEHEEHAYLVMELVDGKTLREVIREHKNSFSLPEQLAIANKIARAVEILNLAGIIHRDIKPDNIIIDDETGDIKLLDLGLAKDTTYGTVQITKGDDFLGTPLYASPEQVKGEHSYQSDIFSLCTVLYQFFLWEDRSPFYDENEFAILYKITDFSPPSLMEKILLSDKQLNPKERECLQELSHLLKEGMDKNPQNRPETANQVADRLAQIQQNLLHTKKYIDGGRAKRIQLSNPVDTNLSKKLATIRINYQEVHGNKITGPQNKVVAIYHQAIEFCKEQWLLSLIVVNALLLLLLVIAAYWTFGGESIKPQENKIWNKAKEYQSNADLLFAKGIAAEKNKNRELLLQSKTLYQLAKTKAQEYFNNEVKMLQKRENISKKQAISSLNSANFEKFMENCRQRIATINNMLSIQQQTPFDEEVWNSCWENGYFDFTSLIWVNLSANQQMNYAKKYQKWYADKIGEPLEKKVQISGVAIPMMLIPPGKFWMGSPITEVDRDEDEKQHTVTIDKHYWIGKYEITQEQWFKVTGKKPWQGQDYMHDNTAHPATYVSWNAIHQQFLPKLRKFTLPTEVQWEYACRGGTDSRFPWGDDINYIGKYANIMDKTTNMKHPQHPGIEVIDGFAELAPVGNLQSNAFGVHDMVGNASEWCQDDYQNFANKEAKSFAGYKVSRGAAWNHFWIGSMRSAYRSKFEPHFKNSTTGFRICYIPK
ncbi:bifunctional serine/threonine-protein kinase/formylglycine-generating enzyme family protein [Candidatus Uabimicrobium amorphum]|uniref:Protein kinase n=1 Tax=Uabimicrobium amorphum TaxID=2596890 RepID=A0A5S9F2C7_UABAM|nr:bifunctional serine/threonine-protein kinase/formylglycine-generating enzyme family protein [Candidatus Uabimicrobium amorphum]BBM81972.1 protein kinase [Candidatus Uabimicrobium amorphum]